MKKFYLALAALALSIVSAFADAYQVPYRSTLTENGAVSPDWTVVDANGDCKELGTGEIANKWAYPVGTSANGRFTTEYPAGLTLYARQKDNNDRIVSPAIHLEAGKEYVARFAVRGDNVNYGWTGSLILAAGDDVEANSAVKEITVYAANLAKSVQWATESSIFSVESTGDYRLALSITQYGYAYGGRLALTNFSVSENIFVPAAPSDFSATAGTIDNPRALSVDLTWTNPSTDIDGVAFPAGKTLEKVSIYRDGAETPVKEFTDGTTRQWTDTEATGLTGGRHSYEIEAVVSGVTTSRVSASTGYVGPILPFDVPCEISLANQDDYDLFWSSEEGSAWRFTASSNGAQMQGSNDHSWLFSPELKFTKPGRYELVLTAGCTGDAVGENASMKVAFAAEATAEAMTAGIVEEALAIPSTPRGEGVESDVVTIDVEEPGTYRLGFSVNATESNVTFYFINAISVDAVPAELYLLCSLNEFTVNPMYRFMSADGDTYTLYSDFFVGEFKIVSGGGDTFSNYNFSTSTPVVIGEAATLTDGETANATIAGDFDIVSEAQFTFTLSTGQLIVDGTPQTLGAPDALYIIGDVNGSAGATATPTELSKDGGLFSLDKVKIDDSGDGFGYFSFATSPADNPEDLMWFNRYGAEAEDVELIPGVETDVKLYLSGYNSADCIAFKAAAGYYSMVVDGDARKVTVRSFVPDDLYLMNAANGFTASDDYKFTTADGEAYTLELDRLAGGFKVASAGYSPYDFSSESLIVPGQESILSAGVSANAFVDTGGFDYLSDVTVEFTLSTGAITVNGSPANVATPDALYLVGNVNGTGWSTSDAIELTRDGDVYTLGSVTIDDAGSGSGYFSFITVTGASWDEVNASDRYGALTKDAQVVAGTPSAFTAYLWDNNSASANSWMVAAGTYDVMVDFATREVRLDVTNGIGSISVGDGDVPVEYFDLRGVRIAEPAAGGIFIERRGAVVRKVVK